MAQIIQYGREMLCINPSNNTLEYTRDGRNWTRRYSSQYYGTIFDLCLVGSDIYAATQKGVIYSHDGSTNWTTKCTSSAYGTFQSLMLRGTEIWATTTKGTYASKDGGRNSSYVEELRYIHQNGWMDGDITNNPQFWIDLDKPSFFEDKQIVATIGNLILANYDFRKAMQELR